MSFDDIRYWLRLDAPPKIGSGPYMRVLRISVYLCVSLGVIEPWAFFDRPDWCAVRVVRQLSDIGHGQFVNWEVP
jgi:hypothetical protein